MNYTPPNAFRGPFDRAYTALSTSTRMTPAPLTPPPVENEVPISQLPLAGLLSGSELIPVVQNGITSRSTTSQIAGVGLTSGFAVKGPVDLGWQPITATSTTTINRALGENVVLSLGVTITSLVVTGWPVTGMTGKVRIVINNTGSFTITGWPPGTIWPGGAVPLITAGAGKKDIILLMSDDGGVTIFGSTVGQDYH